MNICLHRLRIPRSVTTTILKLVQRKCSTVSKLFEGYKVTEVQIPTRNELYISGKLWESAYDNNVETTTPTLCIHGWVDNAGSFDNIIPMMVNNSDVIKNRQFLAIDLPGHGKSSHYHHTHYHNCTEALVSIAAVQQYFGWKKFNLLGHSLGCVATLMFAASKPELIEKLVAVDPIHPPPDKSIVDTVNIFLNDVFFDKHTTSSNEVYCDEKMKQYTYDDIINRMVKGRGGALTPDTAKTLISRHMIKNDDTNLYQFTYDKLLHIREMMRLSQEEFKQYSIAIRCPTLMIQTHPGTAYVNPSVDYFLQNTVKYIRSVQLCHVNGTHAVHLNSPELIAPLVEPFLFGTSASCDELTRRDDINEFDTTGK